jgi:uncharacterized protein (DUF58 family)
MHSENRNKLRYLDPEILQKIGSLEVVAGRIVDGLRIGMHKSPIHGSSTEFKHHRAYVPGDNLKQLDWRVYARTRRYYVRLYEAETNFDAVLLLDASSSMRFSSHHISKLDYAKYLAASLAHLVVKQQDSVGMAVFDDKLRSFIQPKSSLGVIRDIAAALEQAQPEPRTNVEALLHDFAGRLRRRGVVMLFSDLFDSVEGFIKGLNHLRFSGHNVTVFHVLDPEELRFPLQGARRFRSLEGREELLTDPGRIRRAYLDELERYLAAVRKACVRAGADHVLVDTSRPIDETLSSYLVSRMRR